MKKKEDLESLLDGYLAQTLSEEDTDRLNAHLENSKVARDALTERMRLHAELMEFFDPEKEKLIDFSQSTSNEERKAPRPWGWIAIAAAVAFSVGAWIFGFSGSDEEVLASAGVAVLSRSVDAVWGQERTLDEGVSLPKGGIELVSGLAQIEFFSGATVVLEGPAKLDLVSAWKAKCVNGRLRVSVPEPAQGFVVETPEFHAVDLGTEVALALSEGGAS